MSFKVKIGFQLEVSPSLAIKPAVWTWSKDKTQLSPF